MYTARMPLSNAATIAWQADELVQTSCESLTRFRDYRSEETHGSTETHESLRPNTRPMRKFSPLCQPRLATTSKMPHTLQTFNSEGLYLDFD